MTKFVKREWEAGDTDFGATALNRIETGIEEAINLASSKPGKVLDIEPCEATTVKDLVAYVNKLVEKLKE